MSVIDLTSKIFFDVVLKRIKGEVMLHLANDLNRTHRIQKGAALMRGMDCFRSVLLLAALAACAGVVFAGPEGEQAPKSDSVLAQDKAQRRRASNQSELKQLMLVDSVGWIKVNANRPADASMEELQRERQQRKVASLIAFCDESHFVKTAEVDSLREMPSNDRTFCKERLKLINPLIPNGN